MVAPARELRRWFDQRVVDGYLIHIGHPAQPRRLTDDVVPILRQRGLVRAEYDSSTLRGTLGIAVPENRYTRARRLAGSDPGRAAAPDGPMARIARDYGYRLAELRKL